MKPEFNSKFQSILENTKKILNELKGVSSIIDKNDNSNIMDLKSSPSKMSLNKPLSIQGYKNQSSFDQLSVSNISYTVRSNYPAYSSGVQPSTILDGLSPYQNSPLGYNTANFNTVSYIQTELPKSNTNLSQREIQSSLITKSQIYSPSYKLNPLYSYPTYGNYMDSLTKTDKTAETTIIPTIPIQNIKNSYHLPVEPISKPTIDSGAYIPSTNTVLTQSLYRPAEQFIAQIQYNGTNFNQYEIKSQQNEAKSITIMKKDDKDDIEQGFYDRREPKNLELQIKRSPSRNRNHKTPKKKLFNNNVFNHKENDNKLFSPPKTVMIDFNNINFTKTQNNTMDKIPQNNNFGIAKVDSVNSNSKYSISDKLEIYPPSTQEYEEIKNINSISHKKSSPKHDYIDFQVDQDISPPISNLDKSAENYSINYPISSHRERLSENLVDNPFDDHIADMQKRIDLRTILYNSGEMTDDSSPTKNLQKELRKRPQASVDKISKPDPYLLKDIPKSSAKNVSDNLPRKKQPVQKSNTTLKTISLNLTEESMNNLLQPNRKTPVRDIDILVPLISPNKDKSENKEINRNSQLQKKNEVLFSPVQEKIDTKSINYSKRIGNTIDITKQKENLNKKPVNSKIESQNNSIVIGKNEKESLQLTKLKLVDNFGRISVSTIASPNQKKAIKLDNSNTKPKNQNSNISNNLWDIPKNIDFQNRNNFSPTVKPKTPQDTLITLNNKPPINKSAKIKLELVANKIMTKPQPILAYNEINKKLDTTTAFVARRSANENLSYNNNKQNFLGKKR